MKNDEIYKCKAHNADVSAMKRWEISHKLPAALLTYLQMNSYLSAILIFHLLTLTSYHSEVLTSFPFQDAVFSDHQSSLSKAVQAETYEKLHNKLLTEKAQYEVDLEIVKILIKYTGPNELQNTLMEQPFKDFAKKMTKYATC